MRLLVLYGRSWDFVPEGGGERSTGQKITVADGSETTKENHKGAATTEIAVTPEAFQAFPVVPAVYDVDVEQVVTNKGMVPHVVGARLIQALDLRKLIRDAQQGTPRVPAGSGA